MDGICENRRVQNHGATYKLNLNHSSFPPSSFSLPPSLPHLDIVAMRLLSDCVNFEATVATFRRLDENEGVRVGGREEGVGGGSSEENKAEMNCEQRIKEYSEKMSSSDRQTESTDL